MLHIARLNAAEALPELIGILTDAVDSGASVGFLAPLAPEAARAYWEEVAADPACLLWGAWFDGELLGSAQLHLAAKANAAHRAEVAKLMVHRRARRRGLGRALMQAVEDEARRRGRTTLVLDTRQGDPSEDLYRSLGWQPAGVIPEFARSSHGAGLHATALYYKLLA